MNWKDRLRRGEIVAEHEGENLYDVLLSGASFPISRVPCLNFAKVYVGLSVVVDMSDPHTPTIMCASSKTQWVGTRDPEPRTIEEDGWHFYEGHYDHSGWLTSVPESLYVPNWKIPMGVGGGTQFGSPRTVSWYDTDGSRREVMVLSLKESGTSEVSTTAWDTQNSYTLATAMTATDIAAKTPTAVNAYVTATVSNDVGKVIVIYGVDQNNGFVYEKVTLNSAGFFKISSKKFKSISKVEVRKSTPVGTLGAWTTLTGDVALTCGLINESLNAGDQIKFLGTPQKVTLAPTAGSYDDGKEYLSLKQGSFLCVGNEWMQVAGVDGFEVTVGARGLFGSDVVAHASGPSHDLVMVALWSYRQVGSGDLAGHGAAAYTDILYVPYFRTKPSDTTKIEYTLQALDVRTGDFLWNVPTYGEEAAATFPLYYGATHVGVVPDKVPNPKEPISSTNPLFVLDPVDEFKWTPAENPYKNPDDDTDGFVEGYVVVITPRGMAALNRRTGESLWAKEWSEVLPVKSEIHSDNDIVEDAVVFTPVALNATTTLPAGRTVFPYYKYVDVDKTLKPGGDLASIKYRRAMCYRVIDTSDGSIKGTYEFPRTLYVEKNTDAGIMISTDGGDGYLRTVPSPDDTGVDFITIIKAVTGYDYQKGYPSPVVEGSTTTVAGDVITGIASVSFRAISHRADSDGVVTATYDSAMPSFPGALGPGSNKYTLLCSSDYGAWALPNAISVAYDLPSGYCNGGSAAANRRIIYLAQECGLHIVREWISDTKYDWGLDGTVLLPRMSRAPEASDIEPNSGRPYELISTTLYNSREGVAYPLGIRAVVVDPYDGTCAAASVSYLDDPSDADTDDGGGLRWQQVFDGMIEKYSALSDYKYHDPVLGLTQKIAVVRTGLSRSDNITARAVAVDDSNGNYTSITNGNFKQEAYVVWPGFYWSQPGVLMPAQSSNGTIFFGREQLRSTNAFEEQGTN